MDRWRVTRALSEQRQGVDLKVMFPLFIDTDILYNQDIIFEDDPSRDKIYKKFLENRGKQFHQLNHHEKIRFTTCFNVANWIPKILNVVRCGMIKITCNTETISYQLNCDRVSLDEFTFVFPGQETAYFDISIDTPGYTGHMSSGFIREGKVIIYDGAAWTDDEKIKSVLTDFFTTRGLETDFIIAMHQRISGNCSIFQPIGIFLMLIHGVDNFLSAMDKLRNFEKNQLIETTALRMKNLMEGPEDSILSLLVDPKNYRFPSLPIRNPIRKAPSYEEITGRPGRIRKAPSYEEITGRKPVITQEEMDDGWASPLSLTYTRKTSPRKRKTSPKRKRKTSPKRKRKTSPKRKRKTSPKRKRKTSPKRKN